MIMAEYSMGDAINQFLQKSRLKNPIQSLQIEEVWKALMGNTISKYTDSIKINGTTLYISTSVAPLKQELLYQKDKIKERINEAFEGNVVIEEVIIK